MQDAKATARRDSVSSAGRDSHRDVPKNEQVSLPCTTLHPCAPIVFRRTFWSPRHVPVRTSGMASKWTTITRLAWYALQFRSSYAPQTFSV